MLEHENNHSDYCNYPNNNWTRSFKIWFGNLRKHSILLQSVESICLSHAIIFPHTDMFLAKNFQKMLTVYSVADKYFRVRDVCALRVVYKTLKAGCIPFRQYRATVPACTLLQGCPNREMCSNQYRLTHIQQLAWSASNTDVTQNAWVTAFKQSPFERMLDVVNWREQILQF